MRIKEFARDAEINCVDLDFGSVDHPIKLTLANFNSDLDGQGDLQSCASFILTSKAATELRQQLNGNAKSTADGKGAQ